MSSILQQFEAIIGYQFQRPELLERALTHRSHRHDQRPSSSASLTDNEQFEFLGDSILGFVVSEALVLAHPDLHEGRLSARKAHFVSAAHLYQCALTLRLGEHLLLGRGEERNGGRERRNLQSDAVEAVIAAIYLDGGIEPARRFIQQHILAERHMSDQMDDVELLNYKSVLQEQAQAHGLPAPRYSIIETQGPEHAKLFTVEVKIGPSHSGKATGSSKKSASQQAAQRLVEQLEACNWQSLPSAVSAPVAMVVPVE